MREVTVYNYTTILVYSGFQVNTSKMFLQQRAMIPVTMLAMVSLALTAPPSNEKGSKVNVIMETAYIDPKCEGTNWLDKLKIECKKCDLEIQLKECGFPRAISNISNLYEMECSSNFNVPDISNLKLHCPALNNTASCEANCEMAPQSAEPNYTKNGTLWTSLGDSVPGIAGGIMALIILAFLIYVVWRIRMRNQERDARMQVEV